MAKKLQSSMNSSGKIEVIMLNQKKLFETYLGRSYRFGLVVNQCRCFACARPKPYLVDVVSRIVCADGILVLRNHRRRVCCCRQLSDSAASDSCAHWGGVIGS